MEELFPALKRRMEESRAHQRRLPKDHLMRQSWFARRKARRFFARAGVAYQPRMQGMEFNRKPIDALRPVEISRAIASLTYLCEARGDLPRSLRLQLLWLKDRLEREWPKVAVSTAPSPGKEATRDATAR